jgi:flavin-dependent dehydrogenase
LKLPIVVIGGGPAGSVCALQLARLGHEVILAERSLTADSQIGETCGPGVRRLLKGVCGLTLPTVTYRPLNTFFSAWGSDEVDGRSFAFWQIDSGLVLDRMAFDEWLLVSAEAVGVKVLRGCYLTTGCRSPKGWILNAWIDGREQTLNAGFVVEATGPKARSIVQSDVKRFFMDALICLFVELPGRPSEQPTVLIESCADGWWYTTELPGDGRIIAFFTDADLVEPLAERRSDWLGSIFEMTTHTRRLVGRRLQDARLQICSARTSARNVLWRDSWISVGDAAWSLDPLSGAGIERAIKDAIGVASAISQSLATGDSGPLRAHAVLRGHSFREALVTQRSYYAIETRWRDTTFWRRRL